VGRGISLLVAVLVAGAVASLASPRAASADTWCGSAAATDRPDTIGGDLVHLVYAVPSDGPDRFQERAPAIANDLSLIDAWWRRQDPTREPRFDFTSVPGCSSRFGQLDITSARTGDPAFAFSAPDGRLLRLVNDLAQVLNDPTKKYLVYFDSPGSLSGNICGTAFVNARRGSSGAVWLAPNLAGLPGCGSLGDGDYYAKTATHELIHTLGALDSSSPTGPPHPCPGDPGHPCDSPNDVLYPGGFGIHLDDYFLDVGHDDYYGHSGSWFDVQDSPWLTHLDAGLRRVTVQLAGGGSGSSVASDPSGISCPSACAQDFDSDLPIFLSAAAGDGFEFLGWSGDCSGPGPCPVPTGRAATMTATFAPIRYQVAVRVSGRGRVTSRPRGLVSCPVRCRGTLDYGASAHLVPAPTKGYRFVRWGGDCTGRRACVVDNDALVTALFRR
jgi:Divergent InlB B-repeat domain